MSTNGCWLWYLITELACLVWLIVAVCSGEDPVPASLVFLWVGVPGWLDWIAERQGDRPEIPQVDGSSADT